MPVQFHKNTSTFYFVVDDTDLNPKNVKIRWKNYARQLEKCLNICWQFLKIPDFHANAWKVASLYNTKAICLSFPGIKSLQFIWYLLINEFFLICYSYSDFTNKTVTAWSCQDLCPCSKRLLLLGGNAFCTQVNDLPGYMLYLNIIFK